MREKVAQSAKEWIGVPYQHRGFSRNGCDCTGLLVGIAREFGYLKDYRPRKYQPDWNLHRHDNHVVEQLKRFGREIPKDQADVGDIIVMYFGRNFSHCGILVDKEKMEMVHCYITIGKVDYGILRNSKWSKRWVQTYRINENQLR